MFSFLGRTSGGGGGGGAPFFPSANDSAARAVLHPRSRSSFFVITFFAGTLFYRNAGIRISSAWGSRR